MKKLLAAVLLLVMAGCAKVPPGHPGPRGRETPITPTAAPSGPALRGGPHTIKEKQAFTVVADTPDLKNVDLYRLYQDGALWHQLPVAAVANSTISFAIADGLGAGTYTLTLRSVNAEPDGEKESDVAADQIITLTVVGAPVPPKFTNGQRVQVYSGTSAGEGAAVRQPSFGFTSPIVGVQPAKKAGQVLDGPQSADGYTWYRINYDQSELDGWTTQDNLDPCGEDDCEAVPPPPVNCVVSEWSEWAPVSNEWSACTAGKQTREEYRHRDVVTPPANGGEVCPILEERRTVEQPCAVTLPAPTIDTDGTQCRWRFRLANSPDGTTGWSAQLQKGEKVFVSVGNADSSAPYVATTPYQGGGTTTVFSFRVTKPGHPEQRTAFVTVTCGVPQ